MRGLFRGSWPKVDIESGKSGISTQGGRVRREQKKQMENACRELSKELTVLKDLRDFGSRSLFDLFLPIYPFRLYLNGQWAI